MEIATISIFTGWLQNLAIVAGVYIALRQLGSWRREKLSLKKCELGEELYMAASEIGVKISSIRSPFGYGPPEGESDDGTYDYIRRLREIGELDDEFAILRRLKARQKALINCEEIDNSINAFFDARVKLITALRISIHHIRFSKDRSLQPMSESQIEQLSHRDADIWEDSGEQEDQIKISLEKAIKTIEGLMIPYIRLAVH